jgi:flagella basal body P-ring formation protein FlgA
MNRTILLPVIVLLLHLPVAHSNAAGRLAVDIEQQLRASLLTDGNEYIIAVPNYVTTLPTNYDSIKVEPLGDTKPLGSCWIKIYFFAGGTAFQTANVNLQINLYQQVFVANESIRMGQTLTPDLFSQTRREVTAMTDPPIVSAQALAGMSAARAVPAGHTLTQSFLQPAEIIKRGDLVTIEYASGSFKITASGEAKEPGSHGETIKVKNVASNKIISAVVEDERTVKVSK